MNTTFKLISTKGNQTITGTKADAITAAIAMENELQPSFGVTVEDECGETVAEVRDGWVDRLELTPDEQNDAIRAQVDAELPRPAGGFETDEQEQAWKNAQEIEQLRAERDKLREKERLAYQRNDTRKGRTRFTFAINDLNARIEALRTQGNRV
jgi:hypothetical protein